VLPDRAKDEGRLRLHSRFRSSYLSTPRDVVVYLPPGYRAAARYPVFYLQDGQNLFEPATAFNGRDWRADITADELIRGGAIEPILMVGVYHTGVRRISEYTPTRDPVTRKGGKGARYAQMLARELKPFIEREYRARKSAASTAVGGSSLGALVSLEAGMLYPRAFGKLAVMSPSAWWDRRSILEVVRACQAPVRSRIWLDTGTEEGESGLQAVADARLLRDALVKRGWREGVDLSYTEYAGAGHSEEAWGARFGDVLRHFFGSTPRR
jgi:predicted alpha/beta superfamily hydrolase